jgi:cardiolipin synthase
MAGIEEIRQTDDTHTHWVGEIWGKRKGYWSSIGSAHLDNRSFRINDETNVNIFDAEFGSTLAAMFDSDLAQAELWTMERWLERPWHQRVRGWLARLICAHL